MFCVAAFFGQWDGPHAFILFYFILLFIFSSFLLNSTQLTYTVGPVPLKRQWNQAGVKLGGNTRNLAPVLFPFLCIYGNFPLAAFEIVTSGPWNQLGTDETK